MAPARPAAKFAFAMFLRTSIPSVIDSANPVLISTSHEPPMTLALVLAGTGSLTAVVSVVQVPLGVAAPQ
jgi:hypothetical protein